MAIPTVFLRRDDTDLTHIVPPPGRVCFAEDLVVSHQAEALATTEEIGRGSGCVAEFISPHTSLNCGLIYRGQDTSRGKRIVTLSRFVAAGERHPGRSEYVTLWRIIPGRRPNQDQLRPTTHGGDGLFKESIPRPCVERESIEACADQAVRRGVLVIENDGRIAPSFDHGIKERPVGKPRLEEPTDYLSRNRYSIYAL